MQAVIGIDEVGRGCLAGPVVAAAVLSDHPIDGLADSKVLSARRRALLAEKVYAEARAWGIGWVDAARLDTVGITTAVKWAMEAALADLRSKTDDSQVAHTIIIDGNYMYLPNEPHAKCVVRADGSIAAVSAASIIAKVARDTYMQQQALIFPAYGFEQHVGYGTRQHMSALDNYGPCALHRKSFAPVRARLGRP